MSVPSEGLGKPLPMTVHNVAFLLDRLGQDCSPLQFLRELTQNGIEAVERKGQDGVIVWDVDWIQYDLVGEPMRLCIIDTGDGMTGDELCQFINQLSSSGAEQSFSSNYGVGAKIAAATKNPAGVVYQSWKDGQGCMIQLEKNPVTGEYGLRQWELSDGSYSHVFPLEDDVKPEIIDEHGTKVILFGKNVDDNTISPPEGAPAPSRWISKYLNTRYFRFPNGLVVKAREGWDSPRDDRDRNVLRTITGQKVYLDGHCTDSGVHKLSLAHVHWWILKDEPARTNNSGYIESSGHVAALYQNELYDRATARAGTALLQQFGILFGSQYVVLYVEPIVDSHSLLTTNTARTTLLLNGEKLPWTELAYEFRQRMPEALSRFVQDKALASTEKDHVKSIKDRLKGIMDLYRVSRYRPAPQGVYLSDPDTFVPVTNSAHSSNKTLRGGGGSNSSFGSTSRGKSDSEVGNVYHLFEKKDNGARSERTQTDPFPIVRWVNAKDGTRTENDMEDKAAKYLANQNTLLINADFRVYDDMISRLVKDRAVGQRIELRSVVADVVRQWFEQALIETIIGIQQLKGSKEWGPGEVEKALSEEALTSTIMQRYHIFNTCKRDLGSKLGRAVQTS